MKTLNAKQTKRIASIALLVYSLLTLSVVFFHEPWFDEVQAFVLSRDLSPIGLFKMMRYEGHSCLWHLILYPLTHLGLPYLSMQILCWVLMVGAAWILLFRSPFSMPTKLILLFSSGFLYVNVIVARVYALMVLLLMLFACLYKDRNEKPILFGILVALLVNTHVMLCGFIGAIGIYMLYDLFHLWKQSTLRENVHRLVGLGIAGSGVLFLIVQVYGSIHTNSSAANSGLTVLGVIQHSSTAISSWVMNLFETPLLNDTVAFILSMVTMLLAVVMFILLARELWKNHKRELVILIITLLSFNVICSGIWYFNLHRSTMLLLFFFVIPWMAGIKMHGSRAILLISIFTALTIPVGVRYLVSDYTEPFEPSTYINKYIKENIPSNAVIAVQTDIMSALLTYSNSELKIWDTRQSTYTTYCHHKELPASETEEELLLDKSLHTHFTKDTDIYLIRCFHSNETKLSGDVVYRSPLSFSFYGFCPTRVGYYIEKYDYSGTLNGKEG